MNDVRSKLANLKIKASQIKNDPLLRHTLNDKDIALTKENAKIAYYAQAATVREET